VRGARLDKERWFPVSQTLPRRGIEDSMYPKPQPPSPPAFHFWNGWDSEPVRSTVTVLIEFDPNVVDRRTVTQGVLDRLLKPEERWVDGERVSAWRGIRAHAWNTDSTWHVSHG
jgi:hypothetical protein